MEFNRRGFLITLVGSGFASLSADAFASAPDRYKRLIDMATQMKTDTDRYYSYLEEAVGRPRPVIGPLPLWQNDTRSYDEVMAIRRTMTMERTKWNNDVKPFRPLFVAQQDALIVQSDHLLMWTMDNFSGEANDEETRRQVKDLFEGRLKIDILSEEEIRRLEDPMINLVLAKTMISMWQVPMDTQKMESMPRLAGRYKDLIMG